MTEETNLTATAIHDYVDELAKRGQPGLSAFAELVYYAREDDVLPLLRCFVFMSPAEKQMLWAAVDRLIKLRSPAESGSCSPARQGLNS